MPFCPLRFLSSRPLPERISLLLASLCLAILIPSTSPDHVPFLPLFSPSGSYLCPVVSLLFPATFPTDHHVHFPPPLSRLPVFTPRPSTFARRLFHVVLVRSSALLRPSVPRRCDLPRAENIPRPSNFRGSRPSALFHARVSRPLGSSGACFPSLLSRTTRRREGAEQDARVRVAYYMPGPARDTRAAYTHTRHTPNGLHARRNKIIASALRSKVNLLGGGERLS